MASDFDMDEQCPLYVPEQADVLDRDQQASTNDTLRAAPKRQKTGGAQLGPLWNFFSRSTAKRNGSHYDATCLGRINAGKFLKQAILTVGHAKIPQSACKASCRLSFQWQGQCCLT